MYKLTDEVADFEDAKKKLAHALRIISDVKELIPPYIKEAQKYVPFPEAIGATAVWDDHNREFVCNLCGARGTDRKTIEHTGYCQHNRMPALFDHINQVT